MSRPRQSPLFMRRVLVSCFTAIVCMSALISVSTGVAAFQNTVGVVTFTADGRFAVAGADGYVYFWDVGTGSFQFRLDCLNDGTFFIVFSPDGRFVACGGETMTVWNLNTRRRWHTLSTAFENETCSAYGAWVNQVVFSPDSRYLLRASELGASVFDMRTGKLVRQFGAHADSSVLCAPGGDDTLKRTGVERAAISPNGRYVLLWGAGRGAELYDWQSGTLLHRFAQGIAMLTDRITSTNETWNLAIYSHAWFSPDSRRVLLHDNTHLLAWDINSSETRLKLPYEPHSFARFTPDGTQIMVIAPTVTHFYDAVTGTVGEGQPDRALRYMLRFGGTFAGSTTSRSRRNVVIVDVITRSEILLAAAHTTMANFGAFSPDGRVLITADLYHVRLFDTRNGGLLHDLGIVPR